MPADGPMAARPTRTDTKNSRCARGGGRQTAPPRGSLAYSPPVRRFWIALFLIAFLPVRGWAAVTMASAPVLPVAPAQAAAMPCHAEAPAHTAHGAHGTALSAAAHAHADAPGTPAGSADGATERAHHDLPAAAHLCAVCDLCHSPLAAPAGGFALRSAAPEAGPCPATARDTGRLMATSLERPPRA